MSGTAAPAGSAWGWDTMERALVGSSSSLSMLDSGSTVFMNHPHTNPPSGIPPHLPSPVVLSRTESTAG